MPKRGYFFGLLNFFTRTTDHSIHQENSHGNISNLNGKHLNNEAPFSHTEFNRMVEKYGWIAEDLLSSTMEILRFKTGACRALLLKADMMRTGTISSIISESTAPGRMNVFDRWQNQVIDAHYQSVLNEMIRDKYYFAVAEKMPQQSQLRDLYNVDKIDYSVTYNIEFDGRRMLYLSICFDEEREINSAEFRDNIREAENKVLRLKDIICPDDATY